MCFHFRVQLITPHCLFCRPLTFLFLDLALDFLFYFFKILFMTKKKCLFYNKKKKKKKQTLPFNFFFGVSFFNKKLIKINFFETN